uniref:EGF-like domain-containing protein n=1 Tax=Macrostomum lignano TaxID=282301 RepID=A0A1I8J2E3_9PLAT
GIGTGSHCGVQRRQPACQCQPSYRRSGNVCVRANQCGCTAAKRDEAGGFYKAKGQVWYSQACAKKHVCNGARGIDSVGNACKNNTKCVQLPDGAAFCDCAEGFAGPACEDIDECANDLANGSISCACPHGSIGDGYKGAGHSGCKWPNYTSIEGFCYYYDDTKRNHSSAAEYCATLGGTLVTILDERVASQVKVLLNAKLATGNFWTGYADDKTSGYFPPMDFVGSLWRKLWITSGDNSSANSGVGRFRPDMCGSGVLNNGAVKLEARSCGEQLATVCKVPGATRSCPEGWQSLGSNCYYMSDDAVTYEDAMVQCALLGADLVSIGANDVSKFLYDYFFNSRAGSGYHWIGLQYDTLLAPNAFRWWDGSAYNPAYLMWDSPGEPAAGKDCAAISTQARWATRACGDKLGYICQKQRYAYYRCPRNAYYFNGKCYTVISTSQNFTHHLDDCRSLGGDLVAFQTPEEYKFFSRVIYAGQTGPKSYYTGLFLAANATNFTNSDGSKIAYYNWKGGAAPANASQGRCTQIADPAEGFTVVGCSSDAWAVCEFENTPCLKHSDCAANGECFLGQCRCKKGFYGDGRRSCVDIDECEIDGICQPHSTCSNLIGGYKCDCDAGYQLNAEGRCQAFPRRSKQTIDPDGTGPLDAQEVTCEMYADYGITVFPPEKNKKSRYSGSVWREKLIYTTLIDEMTAVVGNSAFCIQTIRYNCFYGANPMEDMLYYDRSMKTHRDWGSGTIGKCLCGTVGLCRQKSASCNCNGDTTRSTSSDYGYITNRDLLPLRGFRGRSSRGAGEHIVGELRCSGVQFDIPATCDEHPDKLSSNVHLIDPDQRGELPPFPALCFNPFCNNALIGSTTVVSHDNFGQRCSYGLSKSVAKGDNPITYCAPLAQLQLLKSMMSFCSQEIRYDCNNSPLVSAGNEASHFYTTGKQPVPNMGFGSPSDNTCPCSALNKCTNGRSCNCDNTGVGWTYDFGWVLNKDQLPIMGIKAENIGPASSGNVSVGYFACSSRQFGIMGTCQMYRTRFREDDDATFILRSYTDNYVYPIDPDLKGSAIKPFPAYCSMQEFDTGVTIIPNLAAGTSSCSNTSNLCEAKARYYHTKEQIASIATRSTYCSQAVTYRCRQSPLLLGPNESTRHAYWKSLRTGASRYDFGRGFQTAPDGGVGCGCAARGGASACGAAGLKCACDAAGDVATSENIQLDDKDALPVESMFVSGKENYVEFGDMMCYDVSESCVSRYRTGFNVDIEETCIYQRLGDLYLLPNQYKGGFTPIPGRCNPGGETEIQIVGGCVRTTQKDVDPASRERCYNIQYYSAGVPINHEQVNFLAKQSTYCIQYARYLSKHTPFSGNVRWTSLYGGEFSQWAGTQGRPGCACGISGVCKREGDACNTDRAASDWSEDRGWFVNFRGTGDLIPMTQLCTKLGTNETAETQICLDSVRCMDSTNLRIPKDCQDIRDGNYLYAPPSSQPRTVEPWIINPYGSNDKPPALATCDQSNTPPIGVTVVGHKTCGTFGKAGGVLNLTYHGFPRHQLDALIQSSTYCTQRVDFKCRSAAFSITSSQGASDKDGGHLVYWGDNAGGAGCKGGACKCDGSADWKDDDGVFTDKSVLPLSSVRLDAV